MERDCRSAKAPVAAEHSLAGDIAGVQVASHNRGFVAPQGTCLPMIGSARTG